MPLVMGLLVILTTLACSALGGGAPEPAQVESPIPVSTEAEVVATEPEPPTSTPAEPTETPSPTAPKIPPSPTIPPGPTAKPGFGNILGRIMWNSRGVADNPVLLCEQFNFLEGCKGQHYDTKTDENGVYLFTDIPPGNYTLATKALDSPGWLYVRGSFSDDEGRYEVKDGETLLAGDLVIYKNDLGLILPANNARIKDPNPVLEWEEYPDATFYIISLFAEFGGAVVYQERVETNRFAVEADLLTCEYYWSVDAAFNKNSDMIAKSDGVSYFYVTDQTVSCYVEIVAPLRGAAVSGENLKLEWKAHPLAATYTVALSEDFGDYKNIVPYVSVTETSYTVNETLKPGKYSWTVSARDEFNENVASTDVISFTVTSP
jgi:hypothetical protein